ncbi:hypothetical protein F4821DRAFT_274548 [Hypoxylon rubiginosum]|uniref:Uncharacterized protein n=1 Tax=Hypoxylon rubiginosum TaxID=110542 RepID=A0ACC0CNC3_9PEZI|nr:hypothetical protein F4821DRAFT_274548 [Hypoxylon rubiginosum]
MRTLSFSVLLTLFASAVIGWDPSQTDCSKLPLCLTSFKWCDPDGAGCYIPDGAYAPGAIAKQALWVLLTEDYNFTISWKVLTANKDIPVRVQWWLGDDGVYWEMNTTDTKITFNPQEIISSFPLPSAPNVTESEAEYYAIRDQMNSITIRQVNLQHEESSDNSILNSLYDATDQFIVGTPSIEHILQGQNRIGHRDEYNKWRLGVGVGVGLGVPILIAVTALSTWVVMRKKVRQLQESQENSIKMSPVQQK